MNTSELGLVRHGGLPLVVKPGLTEQHVGRFHSQFVVPQRDELELLWRRTQEPKTVQWSGMQSEHDRRRRMIHGLDTYAVVETGEGFVLAITAPHVWFQVASPIGETNSYAQKLRKALQKGKWIPGPVAPDFGSYQLDDLRLEYRIKDHELEDQKEGRVFPPGYNYLEVTIEGGPAKPEEMVEHQWGILRSGMRTKDTPGHPDRVTDLRELAQYFPMQLELGCGPSIEAGIPPLHYLHEIYHVQEPVKGTFVLGPNRDGFLEDIVEDPLRFYRRSAALYAGALTAEPTPFYQLMADLHERGIIVGDVITNNFDGLCSYVGLQERYVRRFDEQLMVPQVDFHPEARSLLVVGAHADRRKVERSAREKGMKVIYVDPQGYIDEKGKLIAYPLESAQDGDILVPMTAQQFAKTWRDSLVNVSIKSTSHGQVA